MTVAQRVLAMQAFCAQESYKSIMIVPKFVVELEVLHETSEVKFNAGFFLLCASVWTRL